MHPEIVKYLISRGADVNRLYGGQTALFTMLFIKNIKELTLTDNDFKIANMLLDAGADPSIKPKWHRISLLRFLILNLRDDVLRLF